MGMTCRCKDNPWAWVKPVIEGLQMKRGYWERNGQGRKKETHEPGFECEGCNCKLGTGSIVIRRQD